MNFTYRIKLIGGEYYTNEIKFKSGVLMFTPKYERQVGFDQQNNMFEANVPYEGGMIYTTQFTIYEKE